MEARDHIANMQWQCHRNMGCEIARVRDNRSIKKRAPATTQTEPGRCKEHGGFVGQVCSQRSLG